MTIDGGTYLRIDEPREHVILATNDQAWVERVYGPFASERAAVVALDMLKRSGVSGTLTTCPLHVVETDDRTLAAEVKPCTFSWSTGMTHQHECAEGDGHEGDHACCYCRSRWKSAVIVAEAEVGGGWAIKGRVVVGETAPEPLPPRPCTFRWSSPPCLIKGSGNWHNCSRDVEDDQGGHAKEHLCFCGDVESIS